MVELVIIIIAAIPLMKSLKGRVLHQSWRPNLVVRKRGASGGGTRERFKSDETWVSSLSLERRDDSGIMNSGKGTHALSV